LQVWNVCNIYLEVEINSQCQMNKVHKLGTFAKDFKRVFTIAGLYNLFSFFMQDIC